MAKMRQFWVCNNKNVNSLLIILYKMFTHYLDLALLPVISGSQ